MCCKTNNNKKKIVGGFNYYYNIYPWVFLYFFDIAFYNIVSLFLYTRYHGVFFMYI